MPSSSLLDARSKIPPGPPLRKGGTTPHSSTSRTIEQAVVREVREEAGVVTEVQGVLGIRNRYDPDNGNSLYVVLLLRQLSGEPTPDEHEVDRAEYFTLEEIKALVQVPSINLEVAHRALAEDRRLLCAKPMLHNSGTTYNLFVG